MDLYARLRPALFRLPADRAHDLARLALRVPALFRLLGRSGRRDGPAPRHRPGRNPARESRRPGAGVRQGRRPPAEPPAPRLRLRGHRLSHAGAARRERAAAPRTLSGPPLRRELDGPAQPGGGRLRPAAQGAPDPGHRGGRERGGLLDREHPRGGPGPRAPGGRHRGRAHLSEHVGVRAPARARAGRRAGGGARATVPQARVRQAAAASHGGRPRARDDHGRSLRGRAASPA